MTASTTTPGCYSKLADLLRGVVGLVERMPNAHAILTAPSGKVVLDAKAVLLKIEEIGMADLDSPKTEEEWRLGWIVRENATAFWKGKAEELERMLKEKTHA